MTPRRRENRPGRPRGGGTRRATAGRWTPFLVAAGLAVPVVVAGMLADGRPSAAMVVQTSQERFPHEEHEGLFPLCSGCHQGVESGVESQTFPEPASCAGCHDGVERARVDWSPPAQGPSLLAFDHGEHAAETAAAPGDPPTCRSCHGGDPDTRMDVDPLEAERCMTCHQDLADDPPGHLTGTDCATCHVPAARSGLPPVALRALPLPPSHDAGSFIMPDHGAMAESDRVACATCHVQQRCAACHVDAAASAAVQAVPASPDDVRFAEVAAHYPVPASHGLPTFGEEHGRGLNAASAVGECATCHTQDDCASCHVDTGTFLAGLPPRAAVAAPGVGLARTPPPSHRNPFFMQGHSTLASADPGSCATCHEPPSCVSCHDGAGPARFHPDNFVARHSSASWGGAAECSSCHDAQVFCRNCHTQAGLGSEGRLGPGYHDAEPVWLLRHGQAARQGLESCASCHRQNECLQCHSQRGSFRVSPHAPDFDARRAWERNPSICSACHLRSPFGDGGGM